MNSYFFLVQIAGALGMAWIIVRVLGPFASALAKRLEGSPSNYSSAELAALREELDALQERMDFMERAMAAGKDKQLLPPRADQIHPRPVTPV